MFGYQIGFNVDGEDQDHTVTGCCVSLFIFAWMGVVLHYLIRHICLDTLDRPMTLIQQPNFYGPDKVPITTEQGFRFAIGVSNPKNFNDGSSYSDVVTLQNYATVTAEVVSVADGLT